VASKPRCFVGEQKLDSSVLTFSFVAKILLTANTAKTSEERGKQCYTNSLLKTEVVS